MTDPIDSFPDFVAHVRRKLEAGRAFEETNPAVERPTLDLLNEIQDELVDVCGWSACLWAKLEALKVKATIAPRYERDSEEEP